MTLYHNSRDELFRRPFGAMPAGGKLTLRIRAIGADIVKLRLWHNDGETLIDMHKEGELFASTIDMPETPGLLWYFFIAEGGGERLYYGNAYDNLGGEGCVYAHEPPSFQVTVFDPSFTVQRWLTNGVFMQIMPDRFYASRKPNAKRLPKGAYYHENWYDSPDLNIELDATDSSANDFFGGDLLGICEKLPYLASLGVSMIYLTPVFKARSNHKYDTGDYSRIDPSFGTEADFVKLCETALSMGIRIILDGVFSHTGADSVYFNKLGTYGRGGAYNSQKSKYFDWYDFMQFPDKYECWWGFRNLPNVNEALPGYMDFIIEADDSIEAKWLNAGASGWRLDVADELPLKFLRAFRRKAKQVKPDSVVIGEVWEDPTNKVTYGELRCYAEGDTLDGAMNYPLREAIIEFLTFKSDAYALARVIENMRENMPAGFLHSMMNLLGSHDKPRIINVLADCGNMQPERQYRYPLQLTPEQYALGKERFIKAWRLLCALPGAPMLYYGDEAGLTGMADPFNRCAYPWGREDKELLSEISAITNARRDSVALTRGHTRVTAVSADIIEIERYIENGFDALGDPAENDAEKIMIDRR